MDWCEDGMCMNLRCMCNCFEKSTMIYDQLNCINSKWYGLVWMMDGVGNWDTCVINFGNLK